MGQKINLLGQRVLILKDEPITHSPGGLILLDQSQEEKNMGTIVLCGETANKEYDGKRALFPKHVGQKFVYNDVEHLLIYQHDLIALLN